MPAVLANPLRSHSNKPQKLFGFLFAAFSTIFACSGQSYHLDLWRTDEGLPQGTVTSVVQTPDGYLWLGTQNGLVRFDGVQFKVFNRNNTPAIKNNRIVQLFVERSGALWIGAEQGSLTCLRQGNFISCAMPGFGSPFNYARAFCEDASGQLWMTTCEWRLMRMARQDSDIPVISWNAGGIRPNALTADHSGTVYMGTENRLAVWTGSEFQSIWTQTNEPGFEVEFLATARAGGCWVAGNGRLRRFEGGNWVTDLGPCVWTNQPIYGLFEDSRSQVWIATRGGGLFRFEEKGNLVRLTTKDGLPTDFVRCITEDREGNIWFGMEGGGLGRLKAAMFQALGSREGLGSDQVMSMCEARDGSRWIGSNGRGLDRIIGDHTEHYGVHQGLMNDHVWSVIQDRRGTVWAGTWGGLFKLENGRFNRISAGNQIGGVVLAIYEDSNGALWLGQQGISGITRIIDGQPTSITLPGASPGLDIRAITQDREGWLWFGTENEGLYRWKDNKSIHVGSKEGLASQSIWSLYAEPDGTVWIGTCGGGLSRWRLGKISTWTTREGLGSDVICQILDSQDGNLWLGTYGGVVCVNKSELDQAASACPDTKIRSVVYSKADGLPSTECQGGFQPSGLRSHDGRLWFPTTRGMAILEPTRIATNPVAPIVLIEDLVIDGAIQQLHASATSETSWDSVKISPGKRAIEVRYTATSLTAPEKVQFKYRLEDLETDWIPAGGQRMASYNRLPPGEYSFCVVACNSDGLWNEKGARLHFTILPFFWQTMWFKLLSGMALLMLVFASVRLVATRRLKLRLERLEREQSLDRERTRIAKDIHDDLGASLTEITLLSELAQAPESSAEKAQADISRIAAKARTLTQMLDEIVWAINPQRDSLENFVTYTCTYAEDYLRLAKIQCRLELPGLTQDIPLESHVRHGLFLVIKEALNNVVKHSGATEVRISIGVDSSNLSLQIRDNGKGFDAAAMNGERSSSCGEGLGSMRQRLEALGGKILLSSQPGFGTQVQIFLPVTKIDL